MNKDIRNLKDLGLKGGRLTVAALALLAFILVFYWLFFAEKNNTLSVESDDGIDITPEQIQAVKDIGQWEFLSIADEELVDTTRKKLFSDDHLARIYYGTLRLGVDLQRVQPNWLQVRGDSLVAVLPKVGLLDNDFIDEARTKAFYESGTWTAQDREALYERAYRLMKAHTLTPENLRSAQDNADAQFRRLFKSMGYNNVVIRFED